MATILCIDDGTYGFSHTVEILRMTGHRVFMADNPQAALQVLLDHPVHAVLLDCHELEQHSGMASALRLARPEIPLVMTSAYCSLPCTHLREADACVQKGDSATLVQTISTIITASRFGLCRSVSA